MRRVIIIIMRDNKVKDNAYNEYFALLIFNDNNSLLNFIRIAIKNDDFMFSMFIIII